MVRSRPLFLLTALLCLGCSGVVTPGDAADAPTPEAPEPEPEPEPAGDVTETEEPSEAPEARLCGVWSEPGRHQVTVPLGDTQVTVPILVPRNRTRDALLMLLHGGNGTTGKILKQTEYDVLAEKAGFVLAIPDGIVQYEGKKKWNSGKYELPVVRDDVGLLDALAALARSEGCIEKVAALGFSNGAQMANRLACEGTQVDAIVASAGALMIERDTCTNRPVHILSYVGEGDPAHLNSPSDHKKLPSIVESCQGWRTALQCGAEPVSVETVGKATCKTYVGKAELRECVVAGMSHRFPTARHGLDGTQDSWAWLQKHGF